MMIDYYHIYFRGELLFKDLSKEDFEFVWDKLYTSYINALDEELSYEMIREKNIQDQVHYLEPSF